MARRDVGGARKTLYYAGGGLSVVGALLFFSTFVSAAVSFGDFSNFQTRARSTATRAVVGMGLMIAGGVLAGVGRAGLAGSGLLLDPRRAREDLEPWNRAAGGMAGDALDEAGIEVGRLGAAPESNAMPFDEKLRRLHALREEGLLCEQEYQRGRREALDEM